MMFSIWLCKSAVFVCVLLCALSAAVDGNDSPGFFLKVTKNVPRLGRRSEAFNAERSKRVLLSPAAIEAAADREYSVVQPVTSLTLIELLEQNLSDNMNFVFWKDFDRALQMDPDLYAKVMSLGRKPDQNLKADLRFNNYPPSGFNGNGNGEIPRGGGAGGGNDYMYHGKDALNDMYAGKYDRYDNFNNL